MAAVVDVSAAAAADSARWLGLPPNGLAPRGLPPKGLPPKGLPPIKLPPAMELPAYSVLIGLDPTRAAMAATALESRDVLLVSVL
jgi:hypothetical protein